MKKILFLTKTLLAAVLLCVGQSAWATVTPFSESYSSTSTTAGWSTGTSGRFDPVILSESENYFLSVNQSNRNNNGATVTGTIISGKAEAGDDFTITFDMRLSSSSNQTNTEFQIKDASNSENIISLKETGTWATTWTINGTSTQVTLPNSNKAGGSNTIADVTWCSYKITRSGSTTYLTITNKENSEVILARTPISGSSATGGLGKIVFISSRYLANFAIDNIVVREIEDGDLPTETYYTATFTDNTTSTDVTLGTTIYTTDEKTETVANGALENGKTYYYTATKTAYQDYEGSFTVDGANPAVSFSMTAQPTYSYTVNAVDGSSNVLATLASGSSYNTASVGYAYPQFVLKDGVLYTKGATSQTFGTSFTLSSDKQVEGAVYSTSSYANVVYYAEAESIEGMTASNSGQGDARCSNKYGAYAGEDVDFVTLPAGTYKIHAGYCGSNGTTFSINYGESTVWSAETNGSRSEADGASFTVDGTTPLTIKTAGSANVLLDNIIIQKTGEVATIGTYGYATFSSKYPVNVDADGLEAYIAAGENEDYVTMEKVTGNVAAGTGLVLKGDAGTTYALSIVASGETYNQSSDPKNYLFALDGSFDNVTVAGSGTNYVLSVQSGNVVWAPVTGDVAPAPAGHAALWLPSAVSSARAMRFTSDITGVDNVEAAAEAKAQDGKFIENGKIVIVKNGVKYNAAGQQVK